MKASGILIVALVACGCNRTPQLPRISFESMDHVVAAQISNSLAVVRDTPGSGAAWGELGMVLKSAGLQSEAHDCFVRAERLDPKNARWPYFQGTIDSLKRAAALATSEHPFIRTRLAQMLLETGRFAEASDHFRAAGDALGLAQVAYAQGNWKQAAQLLEQARRNEYSTKAATTLLAAVQLHLQQPDHAGALSTEAAAMPPDRPQANAFESELARYATGKRAWIEATQQLLAQGQLQPALVVIDRLVATYPQASEGWLYLGRAQLMKNDLPAAEQTLSRHLQLDPASVDGHLQMGLVYHRQNRLPQAATEFRKALEAKPDSETAHYFLGVLHRAQGNTYAASNSFAAALRYQPTFDPARKALDELSRPR